MIAPMKEEDREVMARAMLDDPETVQSVGRIAVATLKSIYDYDVSDFTVMEITNVIECLRAARVAKLQRHLGIFKGE